MLPGQTHRLQAQQSTPTQPKLRPVGRLDPSSFSMPHLFVNAGIPEKIRSLREGYHNLYADTYGKRNPDHVEIPGKKVRGDSLAT
jgi:hypothetical protein